MNAAERHQEIINILVQKGHVRVGELAKIFSVSTETIRKDLLELESKRLIKKNNGSAEILRESSASAYARKSKRDVKEKQCIARLAAAMIPKNSVIFIDAGSTNFQLASQLIMRKDIMVATNFTPIVELMNANDIRVISIGGEVRPVSGAATGPFAHYCISRINADIAFVGSSGFLGTGGPCVENFPEAEVKQEMIKNAQRTYVLADHSKLHIRAIAKFADWSEITGVIMDEHAAPEDIKELQNKVDVLLAKKEG